MIYVEEMILRLTGGSFGIPVYVTMWKDLYFAGDENLDTFIDNALVGIRKDLAPGVQADLFTNKQLELIW